MPKRLTASQIEARLERDIARHPACRGFRIDVRVRRLEHGLGPRDGWEADFHANGGPYGHAACRDALLEILDSARGDYALSLDS